MTEKAKQTMSFTLAALIQLLGTAAVVGFMWADLSHKVDMNARDKWTMTHEMIQEKNPSLDVFEVHNVYIRQKMRPQ